MISAVTTAMTDINGCDIRRSYSFCQKKCLLFFFFFVIGIVFLGFLMMPCTKGLTCLIEIDYITITLVNEMLGIDYLIQIYTLRFSKLGDRDRPSLRIIWGSFSTWPVGLLSSMLLCF